MKIYQPHRRYFRERCMGPMRRTDIEKYILQERRKLKHLPIFQKNVPFRDKSLRNLPVLASTSWERIVELELDGLNATISHIEKPWGTTLVKKIKGKKKNIRITGKKFQPETYEALDFSRSTGQLVHDSPNKHWFDAIRALASGARMAWVRKRKWLSTLTTSAKNLTLIKFIPPSSCENCERYDKKHGSAVISWRLPALSFFC